MSTESKYNYYLNKLKKIKNSLVSGDLTYNAFLNEMLAESIESRYFDLELESYIWKSWLLFKEGNFLESKNINDLGITLAKRLNKEDRLSSLRNNRALILSAQGKRSEAIKELFKCLEIHSRLKNENKVINVTANIGLQYTEMGDFENGERFFLEAQKLIHLSANYSSDYMIVVNLAVVYIGKKEFKKALKHAKQAVEYSKEHNDSSYKCYSYLTLASINLELKEFDEALKNCTIAEKIANSNSLKELIYKVLVNKAAILYKLNLLKEAEDILIVNIKKISSIQNIILGYHLLYEISKKNNNYKNALIYHELWLENNKKNEGLESKKLLASLEAKYQNELKEREKEILRLQKIEMEQKALRAQLNPHFFFNSLNSINKFIVDNDAENASKFLFKFSSLMRKTLENSEESFITIEEEVAYLKDYLSIEQLRFNNAFQFKIIIDKEIEEDFVKIPTMMLQPYVENCIKHGINGIQNGFIKIEFKQGKNFIKCIIEDNGRGRNIANSSHKSMGTNILDARIKVLNEEKGLNYTSKTIDLKDNKKKAIGTKIELVIPEID